MVVPVRCSASTPRQFDMDLESDPPKIRFRPCGFESSYPIDIETHYCRVCQIFIENEIYEPLYDKTRHID